MTHPSRAQRKHRNQQLQERHDHAVAQRARERARQAQITEAYDQVKKASLQAMQDARHARAELASIQGFFDRLRKQVSDAALAHGLPLKTILMPGEPYGSFHMHSQTRSFSLLDPIAVTAKMTAELMRLLMVESIRDQVNRRIHVRVQLGNGRVRYAISEEAIDRSSPEELAESLAPQLARELVLALKPGAQPVSARRHPG